ncbi:MAG: pilus assembly protein PilM [Acetatifactor sp.]
MAKILSIEVGSSVTRICELDYKVKNPKIYKYFSIPTPQGAQEDGFLKDNGELCLAIKQALIDHQIKTKQVIFAVTSSKIVTREISIPAIKDSMIGNFIKANANDYFPIDLSMYEIAHVVLGSEKSEEGRETLRVMAIAAGKDLIGGYAKFASTCGLKFVTIDYSGNSIFQAMRAECGTETVMVVKVEDSSTVASVISQRSMMLQRTLANGFDRALHAVADLSGLYDADQAEMFKKMCQKPCIRVVLNDKTRIREQDSVYGETEEATEQRKRVTETFIQLTGNLQRVIELYNSKSKENPVEKLILIGMGAEIANLNKLFANELGLPVEVLSELKDASGFQRIGEEPGIGRYVGCIGAVMDPVNLAGEQSKVMKNAFKVNYELLTVLMIIFTIVLSGGLAVMSILPYNAEKKKEQQLKADEQKYAESEVVYKQYLAISKLHAYVRSRCQMTEHPNGNLVAFLQEMEKKLPSDILVEDFVSDSECITLTMRTTSLEEAAKVFQILRGFDSVMDVNVGEATEESDRNSEDEEEEVKYMSFSVICYYYPVEVEDPEAVKTTVGTDSTQAQN